MILTVHTDGGARGNPGPAAIGVLIEKDGTRLAGFGKKIGETTNNVAEYTAVVEALKYIKLQIPGVSKIQFFLDSTLVVNQLMGKFKVKESHLRELLFAVRQQEQEVGAASIIYTAIPREQNATADFFVNQALDA
mgnify:CR=1 FL=1